MQIPRIIILGSTGMLGQEVVKTFSREAEPFNAYSRTGGKSERFTFTGQAPRELATQLSIHPGDFVINCIGWIPQVASGDNRVDSANAMLLNIQLPEALEGLAKEYGAKVLQVATDCVFIGSTGDYSESSSMDATELYGLSKIQGELKQPSAMRIRASIVGPDANSASGLFSWFLSQGHQRSVIGFTNHIWNGVTTAALSKLFLGICRGGEFQSGCFHWVPRGKATKYELLSWFQEGLRLESPAISSGLGPSKVDRTLTTNRPDINEHLWALAGYSEVPSVRSLIGDLTRDELSALRGRN